MKVILIANVSANGKVLLAENPRHTAPQEALGFIIQSAIKAGNIVIGRKTYEVLRQFPVGLDQIFPGVDLVVVSKSTQNIEGVKLVQSPENALEYLGEKDASEVIVGGGVNIYNSFLEKELITDIYLNFIPLIIGDGGILGTRNMALPFKLESQTKLTDDIAQIHLVKN